MFQAAKNLMISKGAQLYANKLIARYGVVNDLKLDPQAKTVEAVCQLHGEPGPITVKIEKYSLVEKAGKKYVQVLKARCSKPWAQALVEDFVVGRQVEVPPWAADSL
jgi:hypothetical protein